MFGNLSGPTLLVILFIVLLLFGAPKLPALARSLGQSMKILKKEVTSSDDESPAPAQQAAPAAPPAPPAAPAPAAPAPAAPPAATPPAAPAPAEPTQATPQADGTTPQQ